MDQPLWVCMHVGEEGIKVQNKLVQLWYGDKPQDYQAIKQVSPVMVW